ncbi:MAG: MCE family protein [Acidobacteriota bacterium]|nr:MCE family protein [Acidobacteriota bacterium]
MSSAASQPEPRGRAWLRIAAAAAFALTALAIVAIVGRVTFLRSEFDLSTLVDDSVGITPSSPVLLNGINVGHVVQVSLSGSTDPNKSVRVLMRFPRRILSQIPEDSTASITAGNLLGDKYMNISRGSHVRHIEPNAEVPSLPTEDIGIVLSRATTPLNQIDSLMAKIDRINGYVQKGQGTLGKIVTANSPFQKHVTTATGTGTQLLSTAQKGQGIANRFTELTDEIQRPLGRLHTIENDLDQGKGSLGRFLNDPYSPPLTAEVNQTIEEAKNLIASYNAGDRSTHAVDRLQQVSNKLEDALSRVESGQGTLGQMLLNPQLLDSLRKTSKELNSLTADIKKHPMRFASIRLGLF